MSVRTCCAFHSALDSGAALEYCGSDEHIDGIRAKPAPQPIDARILALLRRIYWTGEWQTAELEDVLRELEKR